MDRPQLVRLASVQRRAVRWGLGVAAAIALAARPSVAGAQPSPRTAADRAPLGVTAVNETAHIGETVTVGGRATVAAGRMHDRALLISLQDGRSGIWIYRRAPKHGEQIVVPPILEGDSVVATGVLNSYRGSLELVASRLAVVTGGRRVPAVDSTWPAGTPHEGRLYRVRGIAGAQGYSEGGRWLRVRREGSTDSLTLWVPSAHADPPDVGAISVGDVLDVTGVAAIYRDNVDDPAVPQLLPRSAADVQIVGIPRRVYRLALRGALAIVGIGVLVLLVARAMTRRQARALREADARYRQLLALCPDAVIVHDGETVLFANPAAARLLGAADEHALAGRSITTFVGPDEREALAAAAAAGSIGMSRVAAGPPIGRRIRTSFLTDDGALVDVEASTSACRYLDREAAVVVARDIGPQLRYERELRELALLDDLTGLHNRRGFFMFAEAELRRLRERGSSAVLVFADLDGLKEINDRYGHAAGDAALRTVARAMREVVGAQGLAARWSGDEFVALIPDVAPNDAPTDGDGTPDAAAAESFDQRLVASVGRHAPAQAAYSVSASVGARRLGPDASETLAAALAAADAGLYRRRGRMRTPSTN